MSELTPTEHAVLQEAAKHDLYLFSRYMFKERRGFNWLKNWHHELICNALERVESGECKRLIINIPPRYSKTELAVVNFAAWCLGKYPDAEFIHASYSATLAAKNGTAVRDLMLHEAYKSVFDVRLDSEAKAHITTDKGGAFYTVGTGGTLTGFGAGKPRKEFGGAIIIDDPHKADEATSETMRTNVIEWFQNTLESRTNSPDTPIIVIMQRLHESDLAGWLLSGGNGEEWELLKIPVLDEHDNPLWPAKHDYKALMRIKTSNSYVWNGQYMQTPKALGGNIIKGAWFRRYSIMPRMKMTIITVDTALKTKKANDYSVFLVAGLGDDGGLYVIDLIRGKWEAPQLESMANDVWNKHKSRRLNAMYVEDKASGTGLIQKIKQEHRLPIKPVQVDVDKYTRVMNVQGYIESGFIYLPSDAAWVSEFIDECEKFTSNDTHDHDDQVDALVMAIQELLASNNKFNLDKFGAVL